MSDEGHSKTLLLGFINRVKALADEIGDLQGDIGEVLKQAKSAGFDRTKIREVVAWLRKIDKHGRAEVDDAEAIFDLYRGVVDGKAKSFDDMMDTARDRALLAIFAPKDQVSGKVTAREAQRRQSVDLAELARRAREG